MATREEFIRSLRQLADFLTVNPDVPTPGRLTAQISAPSGSDDEKRAFVDRSALAMGVEPSDPYGEGTYWEASLRFGPIEYFAIAIDERHMDDFNEECRLGREALAARKAIEADPLATEHVPEPFVKASPAEVAEAFESSARVFPLPAVVPDVCAKCLDIFDEDDPRHDGHARFGQTEYCKRCVDSCHEAGAGHRCVVCAPGRFEAEGLRVRVAIGGPS